MMPSHSEEVKISVSRHLKSPCPLPFQISGGVLGSESQQQTEHPGAELAIPSDISVIFYNLIRLVADQGNESVTYKMGLWGMLKGSRMSVYAAEGSVGKE